MRDQQKFDDRLTPMHEVAKIAATWNLTNEWLDAISKPADQSRVVLENNKPKQVIYADGRSRAFAYDGHGQLTGVKQPSGDVWIKNVLSGVWTKSDGTTFDGVIAVDKDGTYSYLRADGVGAIHQPNGKVRRELTQLELNRMRGY
jgi:YD repeat-containing protein